MTPFVTRWFCALRNHPVRCTSTWQNNKFQRWECACRARQYTLVVHAVNEACPVQRDCWRAEHVCGHSFHWEGPIKPGKTLQGFIYDAVHGTMKPTYGDTRGTFADETNRVAAVNRTDLGLPSPQEDR